MMMMMMMMMAVAAAVETVAETVVLCVEISAVLRVTRIYMQTVQLDWCHYCNLVLVETGGRGRGRCMHALRQQ